MDRLARIARQSVFRLGDNTREWVVTRQECRAFDRHGIAIAGISEARAPYRIVRPRLFHQEVQVCSSGFGFVRAGNRWVKLGPRKACLSPLRALQAFHAVPGVTWQFAWVHYLPGAPLLPTRRRSVAAVPGASCGGNRCAPSRGVEARRASRPRAAHRVASRRSVACGAAKAS